MGARRVYINIVKYGVGDEPKCYDRLQNFEKCKGEYWQCSYK